MWEEVKGSKGRRSVWERWNSGGEVERVGEMKGGKADEVCRSGIGVRKWSVRKRWNSEVSGGKK